MDSNTHPDLQSRQAEASLESRKASSALAIKPDVLLMDEPASALDPIATLKIEELINELVERYTIVIVTHNMQQAARISQFTGFFLSGRLIENSQTVDLFEHPTQQETENYISGRFS